MCIRDRGYTLKSSSQDELLEAIRTVRDGHQYLCRAMSSQIVDEYLRGVGPARPRPQMPVVTRREREVLTRVATGRQNKEIAAELGLSVWTVRKHRQNLMRKFSLRNAAAIAAFAIDAYGDLSLAATAATGVASTNGVAFSQ